MGLHLENEVAVVKTPTIISNNPIYTGYTQKNCAVSKVNKKCISHLTRAQRTPSAEATVQVSHALPAVRFSCLLRGREAAGPVSKMASQQEKAFCVLRFEVFRSMITVQRDFRARFRKDAPGRSEHLKTEHKESLFLLRRHLGNWPRGPAVGMRNELLVAHEKLGQLLLLTVYIVPV